MSNTPVETAAWRIGARWPTLGDWEDAESADVAREAFASIDRYLLARHLAELEPGERWPTNEDLGGGPTGTRDVEYRHAMLEEADRLIAYLTQGAT